MISVQHCLEPNGLKLSPAVKCPVCHRSGIPKSNSGDVTVFLGFAVYMELCLLWSTDRHVNKLPATLQTSHH